MATKLVAPVTGNVWKVQVEPGASVSPGDTLIIFESMKMEIPLDAEVAGTVSAVEVEEGQAVEEGQLVIVLA